MHQQTTKMHEKVPDMQPRPFHIRQKKTYCYFRNKKNDNIYLKHPGGTSSTDPDQTLWSVASDQGLY